MTLGKANARRTLWIVAAAELLATTLWFAGTAALPQLTEIWQTDLSVSSWLTMAVQLGFVAGALVVAVFNLPDVFSATKVFAVSSVAAAAANALFVYVAAEHLLAAMALRFLVGAFLAGVYPVGMKILAGWFRDGRGTALGVLVGALTVGKAMPYAMKAFGPAFGGTSELPWQTVGLVCSAFALVAAVLVGCCVTEGPLAAPTPPVDFRQVGEAFRNRRLRLANLGYFGHMWELYSMWGWMALLLAASADTTADVNGGNVVALAAFLVIASGAIGCVWAGRVADHPAQQGAAQIARRARVTIVAMVVSGACCLIVPLVFDFFWVLVGVCLVWGVAVVADSAQFSTIVSEVADRRYVGTALAMQTAIGFLLTVVSIRVIGAIGESYGWRWAAVSMAMGPALGILAMRKLAGRAEKAT